jgi:transposase
LTVGYKCLYNGIYKKEKEGEKMKVYNFMSEVADRRKKEYKQLENILDRLTEKYGKESKEVNEFFEREVDFVLATYIYLPDK